MRPPATKLVNVPSFRLQNGYAEVPDFLRLSNSFGKFYAPASDQTQNCPDEGGYPFSSSTAFYPCHCLGSGPCALNGGGGVLVDVRPPRGDIFPARASRS